jgi:hypothetical protein
MIRLFYVLAISALLCTVSGIDRLFGKSDAQQILQICPLQVEYNKLADHFHYFDQVSQSIISFFQIPQYRAAWIERWGLTENDLSYFDRYRSIRIKYRDESALNACFGTMLFAPDPGFIEDPIADAFYTYSSLEEALTALSFQLTEDELLFLKECFIYFQPRIEVMTQFDSAGREKLIALLNAHLQQAEVNSHLGTMRKFYRSDTRQMRSIFLFSAPEKTLSGACYGQWISLRMPTNLVIPDLDDPGTLLCSILVHEMTHYISGCATKEQKERLGHIFLKHCGSQNIIPMMALEEPLVVASQMLFLQNTYPNVYETAKSWFSTTLSDQYMLILSSYVKADREIDADFMEKCGEMCCLEFGK